MNVAFDPWIPVVTSSGERILVSLCSVLTEGEKFADLSVRPHERVALMRLFLCVAHAALDGPRDYAEWCDVPKRLSKEAQIYLTKWKDSFELFHKTKPWLQVSELSKNSDPKALNVLDDDWTPVSKLNFSLAAGNASTLFDHNGTNKDRDITIEEILLSMLSFQCFSPAGRISQVYWNGKQSGKSSKDGPCVPASMIHAFLKRGDLSGTICLNLPSYEDIRFSYGDRPLGRPIWQMPPVSMSDLNKVVNATETYIGRLVPMTRLMRLHSNGKKMLLGDGLVYPTFTDGFPPEPTATVIIRRRDNEEKRILLSYRPTRALWRELSAIVVKRNAEGLGGPLFLRAVQDAKECDLTVAALARDQASIIDTTESVFHIPLKLRTDVGTAAYEAEVKMAEKIESRLSWAIDTYRNEIDHGWEGRLKSAGPSKGELKAKLHACGTTYYWTSVEKNLWLLMSHVDAIGTDNAIPSRDAWRKMLFSSAVESYRLACGQETPRQMRAFAKGLEKLFAKKDETETDVQETKGENI